MQKNILKSIFLFDKSKVTIIDYKFKISRSKDIVIFKFLVLKIFCSIAVL